MVIGVFFGMSNGYSSLYPSGPPIDIPGTWYLGEGLKQGDFFSYSLCHIDYKDCKEIQMDIWIKGDIQHGSETYWLAEVVVYDGNKRIVGTMEMGKVAPEPTGGTENLSVYRSAFKSSIAWLSAFTSSDVSTGGKGSKGFTSTSYQRICEPGCYEIITPIRPEIITISDMNFKAILFDVYYPMKNQSLNIWVVDDFPFPIKASDKVK